VGTGAVALTATAGDERRATEAVMLARLGYVLYWLGCGLAAWYLAWAAPTLPTAQRRVRTRGAGSRLPYHASSWLSCVGWLGAPASTFSPANDQQETHHDPMVEVPLCRAQTSTWNAELFGPPDHQRRKPGKLADLVREFMDKRPADRAQYSIMQGGKIYSAMEIEHDLYEHPDFPK
jgi:hypothetical protein